MEGWAGVDGVMGGFGASRVGRAHLLANRRVNRIVLNPPRPIHHFGSFERSYRLYFLPCGHPTFNKSPRVCPPLEGAGPSL